MNKLSKEKKNKLVLVILGALIVTAAWGFGVLAWQRDSHKQALRTLEQREAQFQDMTSMMARSKNIEAELVEAASELEELEAQMASGDIYSWAVNTLREFRQNYRLDMPQVAQPVVSANQLLPQFPYRQASISVAGTGVFHDLGVFIADFENRFPHARIINLEMKPTGSLGAGGRAEAGEKLAFTMDIIFLIKPTAS
jgi:Tfp pilus assembly protein PilO